MKRVCAAVCAVILMLAAAPAALAAIPYRTYTLTPGQGLTETQTAYEPAATIGKIGDLSLSSPSDIRIGPDGNLYIADTGNRRVVISTMDGELIGTVGEDVLHTPGGVFPVEGGQIYVADEGLESVVLFDRDGAPVRRYGRPDHPLFGQFAQYMPQKVAVDRRGNLYITSKGNTNGVIQIAAGENAEFLGYFGANLTRVNLLTIFRRLIYTQEQMSRVTDVVPVSVTNLAIDGTGLVYTVSTGDQVAPLKKLNVAGRDILDVSMGNPDFTAVAVSPSGSIFAAARSGYIYEYSSEGNLIFIFGAPDDGLNRVGLFKSISAMAAGENGRLYVLDREKNAIQVFAPTEFAETVHTAFQLFNEGKYIESKEPWREIAKMNSLFAYANTGLGEAAYREREYTEALAAFRRGNNWRGYSDAFWELRSNWLSSRMGAILIGLALLAVLWQAVKVLDRRYAVLGPVRRTRDAFTRRRLVSQCLYAFHNIRNPADTAYGIKREGKASWRASFILLFVFWLLFVLEKYFSGFLFKRVADGYFDLVGDLAVILGIFALTVTCCYLVCLITNGESNFRELASGVMYAFAPVFLLKPAVIILTNVLTLGESFFITLLNVIAYGWTAVLVYLAIRNLNGYTFGQTFRVVLLSVFTCLICALLLFIIYVLVSQCVDFISSVFGEAVFKIANR
ncbi:MAG: YIP1 family protein [Oscillospiraceae bacterium]|nr:YIP1 family protein [Oscillospiraceae bacterium]